MSTVVEVKLNLPDGLAKEAARMGLLEPETLQDVLREAVRTRLVQRMLESRKRISASGLSPLSMEEIQAEIEADRAERRNAKR